MDLIRSGPPPAKYSAGRIDNDWSSRHVRLRFEMVVTSIVFYLVANHGPGVIDLPIIDLPKDFDARVLYFSTFMFSVFAAISFFTRSRYERALWPKQELIDVTEIKNLDKEYQTLVSKLTAIQISKKDENDFFHDLIAMEDQLRAYDYSISSFAMTINDFHDENGVNIPVHPKFWNKIVLLLNAAKRHSSFLLERANGVKLEYGEFNSQGYTLAAIPENYRKNYEGLSQILSKITPELKDRINSLKRHSYIRRFQTTILSVWVPGILSILLLLLGTCSLIGKY